MQNRQVHHRIFAALLSLGVLALVLSTVSLVINSATRTPAASSSASLPAHSKALDFTSFLSAFLKNHGNYKGASGKQLLNELERPYISFIAGTLSPSSDTLSGSLEVVIPPALPPFIKDNGKAVFGCDGNVSDVCPQYANDDIIASLTINGTGTNFNVQEPIALKDIDSGSSLGLHDFPITIPLKGYEGWYPQDTYTGDITVAVSLPAGMTPNIDTGPHAQVHSFIGGTVANDYAVGVKPTPKSFQQILSNADDTFAVVISRNWYNQFFVYTVALIPFLFALLFFHLLFFAGGGHGIGRSFEHFTEALVVSVLSVLPLRVVLVPGDIDGLTRVDLVLGVGLVLIVAVAAGKYAREIWTGTQSPPEEDEAEHVGRSVYPDHEERPEQSAIEPAPGAAPVA